MNEYECTNEMKRNEMKKGISNGKVTHTRTMALRTNSQYNKKKNGARARAPITTVTIRQQVAEPILPRSIILLPPFTCKRFGSRIVCIAQSHVIAFQFEIEINPQSHIGCSFLLLWLSIIH